MNLTLLILGGVFAAYLIGFALSALCYYLWVRVIRKEDYLDAPSFYLKTSACSWYAVILFIISFIMLKRYNNGKTTRK
jgi:hypothetical protein